MQPTSQGFVFKDRGPARARTQLLDEKLIELIIEPLVNTLANQLDNYEEGAQWTNEQTKATPTQK